MTYNPLAGMSSVAPQGSWGRKLAPGHKADGRIEKCLWKNSDNGQGLLYIVEYTVVRSTSTTEPPGTALSWVQPMQRPTPAAAKGAVKAFLHAVMGLSNDVAGQQRLDGAKHSNGQDSLTDWAGFYTGSEDNPFLGYYFSVTTLNKPTKRQMDFTLHMFSPFDYPAMQWPAPNFDAFLQKAYAYRGSAPPPAAAPAWNQQSAPTQAAPPPWGQAPAPQGWPGAPPAAPAWNPQQGAPVGWPPPGWNGR